MPPSRNRLLPELVGAVNLALVEAMTRCNLNDTHDLTSYLAANVRGTIKRVLGDDSLICTPSSTRCVARAKGTVDRLYAFETVSLDVAMHPFDDHDEREPLTSPLLPTEAAPERNLALRAQVEEWLALLTPRAQAVLRLLAQETGLPTYRVQAFLQAHRDEFPVVTAAHRHQQALAQVASVYAQLVARGELVTSSKKLAKAAHVRIDTALEFLRAERRQPDAIA